MLNKLPKVELVRTVKKNIRHKNIILHLSKDKHPSAKALIIKNAVKQFSKSVI